MHGPLTDYASRRDGKAHSATRECLHPRSGPGRAMGRAR